MTLLTAIEARLAYTGLMEWVLQLVDEIDDAVAVVRHGWLGVYAAIGILAGGLLTVCATAAAGATLKVRGSRLWARS